MKFKELDIPGKVLEGIRAAGFSECTPVQEQTLPRALKGRDIAAQAQTGTGKTASFLIAIFSRMLKRRTQQVGHSPRALIIAPTRELVIQIASEAKLLGGPAGFRIISVYGGIDYLKQRKELEEYVDVLIGTPGRLIDYLKQKVYNLRKTEFLVIDEADRLFDMGFISDLRFLLRRMSPYNRRQSMLFSATLSQRVHELCYEHMNMPEQFTITPETITVEKIRQELYHVGMSEKLGLLLWLLRQDPSGRYLIFCNTRAAVERLELILNANGFETAAITGDLHQRKRLNVLSRFREGTLPILVATDVASRGLHIDGVTHVINYDIPQDREDYVHRIGRTARAGADGKAISLACEEYVHALPEIEDYIRQKIPVLPITDDMIVTDYRRRMRRTKKPAQGQSGKATRRPRQKEEKPVKGRARKERGVSGPSRRRKKKPPE